MSANRIRRRPGWACFALVAALSLGLVAQVQAQSLELGAVGLHGHGPVTSQAFGVEVALNLPLGLALLGEASRWGPAMGTDCNTAIPDGYACDADGWALLGGLRLSVPLLFASLDPYIQGQRGWFAPTPIPPRDERPAATGLEIGIRFGLGPLGVGVGARRLWVEDHDYEDVFDEEHRYTMLLARLSFGL